MDIRSVSVELLRAGPRHNQLISPTTQYLGVCGNAPAGRVTLPYEHGDLERMLQELRYRVVDDDDPMRSHKVLDRIGRDVAKILSDIPGVSGLLEPELERPQTLTHLRIVLSASELAMLPFEASKVPLGEGSGAVWLALKGRSPVCITRHIRSVSAEGLRWPLSPRVLFIAGPDTPADRHEAALRQALHPWRDGPEDARKGGAAKASRLVVLRGEAATLRNLADTVAGAHDKPFTHVHILAHGAPVDDQDRYSPVGVLLHGNEVVTGLRLATALTSIGTGAVWRPTVVTLATCESGAVRDVRTTHASVAHELHDQGIALVVASQLPLSVEGSVPLVTHFYAGQMWGEHPLVSLYKLRLQLHSCMPAHIHDWASIVAYEAFPSDLASQLEELRYWQSRRAHDGSLQRLEALAWDFEGSAASFEMWTQQLSECSDLAQRLPTSGPFALECAGLRASGQKRAALAAFDLAQRHRADAPLSEKLLTFSGASLQEARGTYWHATRAFLGSWAEPGRRKANLHWLLGQVLSLDVAMGQPLAPAPLAAATLAAETDLDGPSEVDRAWANVSLAEGALLRLADVSLSDADCGHWSGECLKFAHRMLSLVGRGSEHAMTTARQFERYVKCWGNPDLQWALARLGVGERPHWHRDHGLVPTARQVVALLRGAGVDPEADAADPGPPATELGTGPVVGATSGDLPVPPEHSEPQTAFSIEMLSAANGDCLWIEYGSAAEPRRLLVDCGATSTAEQLGARIDEAGAAFELFVLTHVDADHIDGVLPLFKQPGREASFKDIWFNGWEQMNRFLSVRQGEAFSTLLGDPALQLPWNRAFTPDGQATPQPVVLGDDSVPFAVTLAGGLQLTLLSPGHKQLEKMARKWQTELRPKPAMLGRRKWVPVDDPAKLDLQDLADQPAKKDSSAANGSSIALLAEVDGRAMLLTGDAHAEVLAASIVALQRARGRAGERLKLDALKLSHHGSANATTRELLDVIDCRRYLVSTNGSIFQHPDMEAMARVIVYGGSKPVLCFNHRSEQSAVWSNEELRQRWGYEVRYPDDGMAGLRVAID